MGVARQRLKDEGRHRKLGFRAERIVKDALPRAGAGAGTGSPPLRCMGPGARPCCALSSRISPPSSPFPLPLPVPPLPALWAGRGPPVMACVSCASALLGIKTHPHYA